jgi:hypothetical protein
MPRAINKCPECGQSVTPFAAGCAVCGADIAAARRAREQRATPLPEWLGLPRLDDDTLRIGIALIVALVAPLIGLLLACWFAYDVDSEGRTRTRNILIAVAVVAAIPLFTGYSLWGRFVPGY